MPSALDETLKKHRQRIIEREELAFREMLAAYDGIARELRGEIRKLQEKVDAAKAAGERISPSWFSREQRLKSLLEQVERQIVRFGSTAAQIIEREQRAAIRIAVEQANETFRIVNGTNGTDGTNTTLGATLNRRVVENAVGAMGDGSPILNYFEKNLAPAVAEKLRSEIVRAAALGTDFRTIANRLMAAGDITRHRALSTARTEVNRIRRETTRQIYEENSDVITGWEWVAAKSSRTCPVCLALDGRIFKLEEPFPNHINCRCVMIPVIDGVERPRRTLGADWFDRQPDDVKEKILGKLGAAAYNDGQIRMEDFIGWRNSKEFGRSVYTKPLAKVLADKDLKLAGAGGNWPRSNERYVRSIVRQSGDLSCVAAAGEMLAREYGLNLSQQKILSEIGELADSKRLLDFLRQHTGESWHGGHYDPDYGIDGIMEMIRNKKAIFAILRERSPVGHAVLIKRIKKTGFRVFDPFDQTSYNMKPEDLFEVFAEFIFKL